MLKHYQQEPLHFCQQLTLQHFNTNSNDTNFTTAHEPTSNTVNATNSIYTISSTSIPNQPSSVAVSSSTVDTHAINYLFYKFNYFDSQPNQLYFSLIMFYSLHGGARGIE